MTRIALGLTMVFILAACELDVVLPPSDGPATRAEPVVVDLNAQTQNRAVITNR